MNNNETKYKNLNYVIDRIVDLHNNRYKAKPISNDNREHFKVLIKPLIMDLDYDENGYLKVQTIYWLIESFEKYANTHKNIEW